VADEAKVKVGIEGAKEAEKKLRDLESSFKDLGRQVASIANAAAQGFISMTASLAKVDPAAAADRFRSYRREVLDTATAAGASVETIKARFSDLSKRTLLPDDQLQKFGHTLGQITYDFGDSTKAMESLSAYALKSGKSLDQMGGVAEALHNSFGETFDQMPQSLDAIAGAAEALGTTGGPSALIDQFTQLGGVLDEVAHKGAQDVQSLAAVMAAVGKGRTAPQAAQLQQKLVSRFAQGGEQMRLNLGIKREDFYDEQGNVKVNASNVEKLRDFYLKRGGGKEGAMRLASFSGNLGPQLAAALFRPGLVEDMRKAETATPSGAAAVAQQSALNTQAGKEIQAQNAREARTRETVGGAVNAMQQGVAGAMPENPWVRYGTMGVASAAGQIGGNVLVNKASEAAGGLAKSLLGIGTSSQVAKVALAGVSGSLTSILGAAGAVAGGAYLGAKAGMWLDKKTGFATPLAKAAGYLTGQSSEMQSAEDAGVAANKKKLEEKKAQRDRDVAALEAKGYSRGQALSMVDHPGAAKPQPVQVEVKIVDDSHNPNRVVATSKTTAGRQ